MNMIIMSSNGKRIVDVGRYDIWFSLYSTVDLKMGLFKRKVPLALSFLATGCCKADSAQETARQMNLIRDELSRLSPDKAVYDKNDPKKEAPWKDHISPIVTSCSNLFTTADGHDLLCELVSILTYASILQTDLTADD